MLSQRPCKCPLATVCARGIGPFLEIRRKQNHILYLEGEAAQRVYLLRSGSVSLHRMASENDGLGITRTMRHRDSFLGLEALVHPEYQDSARAETPLVLCVADKDKFLEWMGPQETASFQVLEAVLNTDTRERTRQSPPRGSALQRVARWLLDRDDFERNSRVAHRIMAELLGMRPETFSRAVHELANRGWVELHSRMIVIVDPDSLRRLLPGP